jgi:GntR family transcriptional regulator, vanillate catabolism transcriptional regulator
MNASREGKLVQADERRRSDSRVAQRIRQLIVEGSLSPGTRVAEAAIAERLGVSRTPVRNALPLLAGEGLLEPIGKRGFAVRNFTNEDIQRAIEIRCVLEGYACRELAVRDDRGPVVEALRDVVRESDVLLARGEVGVSDEAAYSALNGRFHELIVGASRDSLLVDLIRRVYAVPLVAPDVVPFDRVPTDELHAILMSSNYQHHAIVDAIEAGQADFAESLMRGHSSPALRSLALPTPEQH